MSITFYWHDYETFGVDPSKDRPSQFAGLRTDENLNVIGEPLVIYCQPQKDCVPAPQACLITGITPQHALEHGLPEPDFIEAMSAGGAPTRALMMYPIISLWAKITCRSIPCLFLPLS